MEQVYLLPFHYELGYYIVCDEHRLVFYSVDRDSDGIPDNAIQS
jgi:hypothetical protein